MPSISIALTTHNGEEYLPAQLDSLARQTRLPAELVVTDDASADGTKAIILDFARRAPFPVHFHENESRLGYRDNFMRAVEFCRSDLIAFCDQDDIWELHKLAAMERVFDEPDVCLAFHNATVFTKHGKAYRRLYKSRSGIEMSAPLSRNPWITVPGFAQMFRRDLTRFSFLHAASVDVDWPGETLPHDRWFYFLASVFGRIAFLGEPLARYRQHEKNAFGLYTDTRSDIDRVLRGENFIRAAIAWSKNRSDLLQRMQGRLTAEEEARVVAAISYYDALRQRLSSRMSVYAADSSLVRLKALCAFAKQGGYTGIHGSARFGWKELLMDVYVGVPFGPRARRFFS
ncbi:MAG: glycosyltransferase [Betaproteobacteria bacterium]|nr:glycosyltransferase [Gammaproteobacteria bacterium]MDH3436651.1 glycosyltransferase [Betaproteobacteria bacterium]